jgi:superfamily II DNA/RNA helicase
MIKQDRIALRAGHTQLIVGTPGRVYDLLSRRLIDSTFIGFLGLIEVEELI